MKRALLALSGVFALPFIAAGFLCAISFAAFEVGEEGAVRVAEWVTKRKPK